MKYKIGLASLLTVVVVSVISLKPELAGYFKNLENSANEVKVTEVSKNERHWYQGTIEKAVEHSLNNGKLLLLYWGAEWCPPCHELKNNVFSHPEFSELANEFVAYYLDGDSEDAQYWGEKFEASGYPTVLLLKASKNISNSGEDKYSFQELLRLGSSLSFSEFKESVMIAKEGLYTADEVTKDIKALLNGNTNIENIDAKLKYACLFPKEVFLNDDGAVDLAFLDKGLDLSIKNKVDSYYLDLLRSTYYSSLLSITAMTFEDSQVSDEVKSQSLSVSEIQNRFTDVYINQNILSNQKFSWSLRSMLSYEFVSMLTILPNLNISEEKRIEITGSWFKQIETIKSDKRASSAIRLWANLPAIETMRLIRNDDPLIKTLKGGLSQIVGKEGKIISEIREIVSSLKTKHEKGSTVSGAAYLLSEIKQFKEAERILLDEIKTTSTPWYFYRSLASVASKNGDLDAEIKWNKKASESAVGEATKLQWLSLELNSMKNILESDSSKSEHSKQDLKERFSKTLIEFLTYSKAISNPFTGRNMGAQKRAAKAAGLVLDKNWQEDFDVSSLCNSAQSSQIKERCQKLYF
jgi:protein disulfide-isomerase